jgi:hypothetical protein
LHERQSNKVCVRRRQDCPCWRQFDVQAGRGQAHATSAGATLLPGLAVDNLQPEVTTILGIFLLV